MNFKGVLVHCYAGIQRSYCSYLLNENGNMDQKSN